MSPRTTCVPASLVILGLAALTSCGKPQADAPDAPVAPPPPDAPSLAPDAAAAEGRVLRLEADVDGDGQADAIEVTALSIRLAGRRAEHLPGLVSAARDLFDARVIDLDHRDKIKEVFVALGFTDLDGRRQRVHHVYALAGERIVRSALPGAPGKIPGDGTLVVRIQDCGQTITSRYILRDGELHVTDERKQGRYRSGPGCE